MSMRFPSEEAWRTAWLTDAHLDWHRWLTGSKQPALAGGLPSASALTDGRATSWMQHDLRLVEWLFPADRYGFPKSAAPALTSQQVPVFLNYGALDQTLRVLYVGFLGMFGATVDWHGWVVDWRTGEPGTLRLPHLDRKGILAVARVLRFLHLAGWRGYSNKRSRDPHDFWYDRAFLRWLQESWLRQGGQGPLPASWSEAVRRGPAVLERRSAVASLVRGCYRRVYQFEPDGGVLRSSTAPF